MKFLKEKAIDIDGEFKMKKKLVGSIIVVAVCALGIFCLYPKTKESDDLGQNIDSHSPISVSVLNNEIKIALNKVGSSGSAKVYAYEANEYQSHDKIKGISTDTKKTGTLVGTYKCGTKQVLSYKRYDSNGRDNLYKKYYVMKNNKILYGPVYATYIASKKKNIEFKQKSIKGLFNENLTDMSHADDLKAHSITININIGDFIYANEDQNGKALQAPQGSYSMKVNGKNYYFNKAAVDNIDALASGASKKKMNVIAVVAAWKNDNYQSFASSLRYNSPKSTVLMGTNTSNSKGRDYVIALMEFLAHRYSQSADQGLISKYVISNEIDFTHYFYDCGDLNTFMEEYSRDLRLSNLAVKKYASDIQVVVPFTHYWKGYVAKMGNECPGEALRPYDMLNWLADYTNKRGAYDWAIAPHCYGVYITASNMANADAGSNALTGSYKTSKQITFSNFEVWQQILSVKKMKYNGKLRNVYLTESGASSFKLSKKGLNEQAASLAQAYYKVAQFSFVKSYNYYRLLDHKEETVAGLSCGLLDSAGKKKPAYDVYKYIDTKDTFKYSNKYLKYIDYKRNGDTRVNTENGKIKSWKDAMNVYDSNVNWNKVWNNHNIYE